MVFKRLNILILELESNLIRIFYALLPLLLNRTSYYAVYLIKLVNIGFSTENWFLDIKFSHYSTFYIKIKINFGNILTKILIIFLKKF